MAKPFNLTAQINLQGPTNIRSVVGKIKRELGSIKTDINFNISDKSVKSVDAVTAKLKAMNKILMESKNYTDGLNASLSRLSSSLAKAGSSTSKVSNGLKETAAQAASSAKSIKQTEDYLSSLGKQAAITVKRFAAFTIVSSSIYGLVNAINTAYKAFLEFDREIIRLQQVTNSGAVGISRLSATITELSTSLGVSSSELVKVAVTLAQAGLSANQTERALSALAKTELAPSFENLTKTTEGAIAAIRQFGLETSDLEKALGSINAVAAAFAVESGDIIAAIQRTGGVFASASQGVSEGTDALNEFIAVFTSVRATTRESAETIATGLRTIFTRIQRGATIDYLKQFNIELQDSEGKFVGAYEAIRRLSEGLAGLDPRDVRFSRIVEELGGFRQIGKVIPLIQQFGTAQEALSVAQQGQNSLTSAAAKAQQSLIVQLAKVREEFNALIRSVGESQTFRTFLSLTLQTTRALIGLAAVFKPILPLLAVLGTVKAIGSIGKFATGFGGAIKKGGGSGAIGQNIGQTLTGASDKEKSDAVLRAANATNQNTESLKTLTNAVNALTQKIGNLGGGGGGVGGGGSPILGPDGRPFRFASGGIVPGSGNRDTVPAMLTPGEFVIRKKAVESIGAGNLQNVNKYASGGEILKESKIGVATLDQSDTTRFIQTKDILDNISADRSKDISSILENKSYNVIIQGLESNLSTIVNDSIKKNTVGFINNISEDFNSYIAGNLSPLGIQSPNISSNLSNFMDSINDGLRGSAFEALLNNITNQATYGSNIDSDAPFDFKSGLGKAGYFYPKLRDINFIDAKAKADRATAAAMGKKIGNEIYDSTRGLSGIELSSLFSQVSSTEGQTENKIKKMLEERIGKQMKGYTANIPFARDRSKLQSHSKNFQKEYQLILRDLGVSYTQGDSFVKQLIADGILKGKTTDKGQFFSLRNSGGFIQKFANGGSAEDTVPALLTPGEFVINKKAASRIGSANLNRMNNADKIQGFNRGGSVGFIQKFAEGGSPVGGLGYPGSMYTNAANEAKIAAEALKLLKEQASAAGISFKRYEKTIKDQIQTLASSKISGKEATRKDIASILVKNRSQIKKAGEGSEEIKAFQKILTEKLRDLDIDIPPENIEKEIAEVIKSIKSGIPAEDILKNSDILNKAMDSSADAAKALKEAHEELKISLGSLTENMKLSSEELANARYVQSGQAEADFGLFGKFAPGVAQAYAQSDRGKGNIDKAKEFLAMKNIPLIGESLGKLNDVIMDMEGPFGEAARAVGGLAGATAIATSIIGSQLPKAFEALGLGQNATAAGIAGGLEQGGSMAASFGALGMQFFGPQGAAVGIITGAIVGGISGFAKAFRTKNLENKLGELNSTLESVNKAFENLDKNRSRETVREAQTALGNLSKNFEDLQLEAQRTPFEAVTSPIGIAANLGFSASLASIAFGFGELAVAAAAGASGAGAPAAPIFGISGGTKVAAGFAGLVASIWASISATNPDEIDKEAFDSSLKAAQEYINGLSKLAEQEINLKSLETIKDTLDPIREAYDKIEQDQKAGNITAEEAKTRRQNLNIELGKQSAVIEQAQFTALAREGYAVDPLKPLADQLSTIDSKGQNIAQRAKDLAAYQAGVAELNRIYGEGSAIAMEKAKDEEGMIKRGYELIGVEYKQQLIQAELANTFRETRIETENLIDKLDKVNAILNRFGTELDELSRQGDILAGVGSGEAELGPINRTNEAMLANMRAYTDAELAPVIAQVGRVVGGETGNQLTQGLQARRILQENLPGILSNVGSQDIDRVETEVRALFDKAGLSEDLGRAFAEQVRQKLDQETGSRQGKSFQELTQEFPALQESLTLIEKEFEVSANALKQYNDAIEQSNEFITKWGQAIERSRELTLRSAQLEVETRNKLLRATGGYVGPTQENEAFLEQISSLTKGTGVRDNQIFVDEISRQYNSLRKEVEKQRAIVDSTQDFRERQKQTKKLDELNRQMNNSYAALEEIANNTSMIDSLISAIERNRARSEAASRLVEDMFSSSPADLAENALNLNMLNDFLDFNLNNARDRNRAEQMFSTQENRQRIVQGLDIIQNSGLLAEQEMARLRAQANIQMLELMQIQDPNFGKQQIVTMETFNPATKEFEIGEKISIEDAIRRRASGEYEDPMREALTDQLLMQKKANDHLYQIELNTAKEYQDTLAQAVNNMVTNLPGMLANAIAQSRAESEARDKESPTSSNGSASGSPPPEPEMFGSPDVAKIRADLEAANQATGEAMRDLQKIRDRREALWFDLVGPYPQEIELEEKIVALKQKELALQKQLEEAIRKQMDKQREDAGYTPPPPSDTEIAVLSQQYQDAIKATGDAMLELEKYKIANPGSKTGPYPGYPRGKSTPERERLEAKVRAAELMELESRKKLEEATRKQEEYKRKEEEEFNMPSERKPEKPTLPAIPDKPIPVQVTNPILPQIPGAIPMGGCCEEILEEIRLLKQALIANTFLIDLENGIRNAFIGLNIPMSIEPSSKDFLNSFSQSFNTYITRLERAFPEQIQIVGRHSVNVNIAGADVFNEMQEPIRKLIVSEVNKELNAYTNRNGLPPVQNTGSPVGAR